MYLDLSYMWERAVEYILKCFILIDNSCYCCRGGVVLESPIMSPAQDAPPVQGFIWMDELGCAGDEATLADCAFSGWGVHNCGHERDVHIQCMEPAPPAPAPST